MIIKKSQSFELSTQHTLGILDTKFNHNNSIVGRQTKFNGMDLNTTAVEQFSKPGSSVIDESTATRCIMDHQHINGKCLTITSCDLTCCYDSIVHTTTAIALLRIGVSHTRIKSMVSSIQKWFIGL